MVLAVPITAQLLITCILDTFYPEVGKAVMKVCRSLGVRLEFPAQQTCCGQPAFNAGMRQEARRMAMHTISVFEQTKGKIILPSGSCTAMMRHGYLELFAEHSDWLRRARSLAERVVEFSEFLVDELGITDTGASFAGKVAYHPSCHLLRGLGVDRQPRALLSNVRGAQWVTLPEETDCCGFGGVFSVEFAELSSAMLQRKVGNILHSGAFLVVTADAGCMMHINGALHRLQRPERVVHLAQLLAGDMQTLLIRG